MSPRPRSADACNALHELTVGGQLVTYRCGRARGHRGYHNHAGVEWGKLWGEEDRTPPPPRRPEESRPPA